MWVYVLACCCSVRQARTGRWAYWCAAGPSLCPLTVVADNLGHTLHSALWSGSLWLKKAMKSIDGTYACAYTVHAIRSTYIPASPRTAMGVVSSCVSCACVRVCARPRRRVGVLNTLSSQLSRILLVSPRRMPPSARPQTPQPISSPPFALALLSPPRLLARTVH